MSELNMQALIDIANQFKDPHPTMAKMCSPVLEHLRSSFGQTDPLDPNIGQQLAGCPIYVNEEIPPDRIVFYDQDGDVYEVVPVTLKETTL